MVVAAGTMQPREAVHRVTAAEEPLQLLLDVPRQGPAVMLTTRSTPDAPGLYHCIVRYRVGGRWHRDDPSARLGMNGGRIDPLVKARWAARASAQTRPERAWRTA